MSNNISNQNIQARNLSSLEPKTPTEKELARIWSEILGISSVAANSDFFDLGGNSLSVIKLLARAEEAFGEDVLSPDTALEKGQLAEMAAAIDSNLRLK